MGRRQKTGGLKLSQKLSALQKKRKQSQPPSSSEGKKKKKVGVGAALGRKPWSRAISSQCPTRVAGDPRPGTPARGPVSPAGPVNSTTFSVDRLVNTARKGQSPALPPTHPSLQEQLHEATRTLGSCLCFLGSAVSSQKAGLPLPGHVLCHRSSHLQCFLDTMVPTSAAQ